VQSKEESIAMRNRARKFEEETGCPIQQSKIDARVSKRRVREKREKDAKSERGEREKENSVPKARVWGESGGTREEKDAGKVGGGVTFEAHLQKRKSLPAVRRPKPKPSQNSNRWWMHAKKKKAK